MSTSVDQKRPRLVPVDPPPEDQRICRGATFAGDGERKTRYTLPTRLQSASPVGYRTRISLSPEEAEEALALFSMPRPTAFAEPEPVPEQELFEECSLGVLTSRQSTNYRGHRQITFGPEDSEKIAELLRGLAEREAPALAGACHTHVVLSRPYRTPFTMLLTLVGHKTLLSLLTVPIRILRKRLQHADDIPTIGYLQHLHLGILADAMERAAVLASGGRRRAQVFAAPFAGRGREANRSVIRRIERLCGLGAADRARGWRMALVTQVGRAVTGEEISLDPLLARRLGANLMAFRSERIQPGVNAEDKAPAPYQARQDMDVRPELVEMAGRAAYNAFTHWAGCDREDAKDILLMDRVDVLTPRGKERLRAIRTMLEDVTDRVIRDLPLWADLPVGRAFSRNANRGRKAFSLAGQRIYIAGLAREDLERRGMDWYRAVRAVGAAAARSAFYIELMGCVNIPRGCDLLAGMCLMAGPVNQNDIGKEFYGLPDLLTLSDLHPDPTSLLVWTLKAKTVADPVGNEEQLLNAQRKGALVDLRPGPHEVILLRRDGRLEPMRQRGGEINQERAFADQGNFVVSPDGREIDDNRGKPWTPEGDPL